MRICTGIVSVLCLLGFGCANQVTPSGGKKDITPPRLISANPIQGTLNFKAQTITLRFNEFLQPIDASKVYITPELSKNIKIIQAHKNIILKLSPPYRDSTTYTIHFNNTIADNNEGNKLLDFEYVFSTGSKIDSLKMQGLITDAFTNKPFKDVLVMLYDKNYDSAPYKQKPEYFTRTDENGVYSLTHIRAGRYKAFALKDNDGDLKYSQVFEKIGFKDSSINIKVNVSKVNMVLFTNKPSTQKIIRATCTQPGVITIKWTLPQNAGLSITSLESELFYSLLNNSDSLTIYVNNIKTDSVKLFFANGIYKDTALVMMKPVSNAGRSKLSLTVTNNLICDKMGCKFNDTFILSFNHPLVSVDTSRIIFYQDTGKQMKIMPVTNIMNAIQNKIAFPITVLAKSNLYSCIIKKGAFKDIYGLINFDSIKLKFSRMTTDQKGNLLLSINGLNKTSNMILFLMKDNIRIMPNNTNTLKDGKSTYSFKSIIPGSYTAYMVIDDNHNGYWDTGDYLKHVQPEKIIVYPTTINIRGNWDNELTWDIK